MQQVTLEEAVIHLPDLLDAAVRGEVVFIKTETQQIVQLVPIQQPKQPRRPGSAKGMIYMADDFDAPLDDFREYME